MVTLEDCFLAGAVIKHELWQALDNVSLSKPYAFKHELDHAYTNLDKAIEFLNRQQCINPAKRDAVIIRIENVKKIIDGELIEQIVVERGELKRIMADLIRFVQE